MQRKGMGGALAYLSTFEYFCRRGGEGVASSVNINTIQSVSVLFHEGYCHQNKVPSGKIVPRALLLEKP